MTLAAWHVKGSSLMATPVTRVRDYPVEENIRVSGIWAFESRHGDHFSMPWTTHPFPKLLLIREGQGQVSGDWGDRGCKTGDCVLVPPRLKHRIVDDPAAAISLYGLGVATKLLSCAPGVLDLLPTGVLPAEQLHSVAVEQRLRRILYLDSQDDKVSQLSCVAAALDLFAELATATAPSRSTSTRRDEEQTVEPLIESYCVWLQHHFFEPVTLDAAAHACGMSRRHFTGTFRQYVGMTWLEYLHRLRVQYATELLQETDRKIASIAFQSGFDDLTTFYRVVAKVTGKRPGELRVNPR
jgi:AraC-like DNA-binding protein